MMGTLNKWSAKVLFHQYRNPSGRTGLCDHGGNLNGNKDLKERSPQLHVSRFKIFSGTDVAKSTIDLKFQSGDLL